MHKRLLSLLLTSVLTAVLFLGAVPKQHAGAMLFTPNCTVQSEAAILMNLDIGQIVYEKNADKKELPGALSQIMTAVLVLEHCTDISGTKVTAGEDMFDAFQHDDFPDDLRYANIKAEDTLTVEDLLYAMMLTSSCEAAYMLCEYIGGTEENFVNMMNDKAAELGMDNSRFTSGAGLYSARQLTTARDMLTLLKYAITLPHFETIACTDTYTPANAEAKGKAKDWTWKHSNLMMDENSDYYCVGARGIKTGSSSEGDGHRNIACKAGRDGNNYLLVCLNAPLTDSEENNRFYHLEDAKNILDWAYTHLTFIEVLSEKTALGEVPVNNAADDANYVIVRPTESYRTIWCDTTDITSIQRVGDWAESVEAPVHAGDKLGTVTLKLSGETLAEIDVVASNNVERSFWKYNLSEIPGFFRSKYLRATWVTAIILSVVYIGLCIFFAFRYHEDRKRRAAARAGHLQKK